MKNKITKNKFILGMVSLILVVIMFAGTIAVTYPLLGEKSMATPNSEIKVIPNNTGGNLYSFTLSDSEAALVEKGYQLETADYIYTYGYSRSSSTAATYGSLTGWTEQSGSPTGWGVATKDKTKTSYEDIYSMISDVPVTSIAYAFAGCSAMTTAPQLSAFATDTTAAFSDCTNMNSATMPIGLTNISASMFKNCSSLTNIYIASTVTSISASNAASSPFSGCNSSLKIYCGVASAPSGWGAYWNNYDNSNRLSALYGYAEADYEVAIK